MRVLTVAVCVYICTRVDATRDPDVAAEVQQLPAPAVRQLLLSASDIRCIQTSDLSLRAGDAGLTLHDASGVAPPCRCQRFMAPTRSSIPMTPCDVSHSRRRRLSAAARRRCGAGTTVGISWCPRQSDVTRWSAPSGVRCCCILMALIDVTVQRKAKDDTKLIDITAQHGLPGAALPSPPRLPSCDARFAWPQLLYESAILVSRHPQPPCCRQLVTQLLRCGPSWRLLTTVLMVSLSV